MILNVNKFACNITLWKHYYQDTQDVITNDSSATVEPQVPMGFREQCAVQDLEELQDESVSGEVCETTLPVDVPFKLRSDYYPVNSRGKALDTFQRSVKRELTRLALHTGVGDMSLMIISPLKSVLRFSLLAVILLL